MVKPAPRHTSEGEVRILPGYMRRLAAGHSLGIGLILLLAATLRLYRLDGSSLWSDEGNSWALAGRSVGQIARDAARDIHPPGYYWLLKAWTLLFGTHAWGMRSLSALLGVMLVWVIYGIGCRLATATPASPVAGPDRSWRWVPYLAASLAALNPFQVFYAQEARMYMLLALAGAGLFWALLALMPEPSPRPPIGRLPLAQQIRPSLIYWASGTIGLWTHYSFPVILAAAGCAYLWYWWRRPRAHRSWSDLFHFGILNLLILLAYAPWIPIAAQGILNWPKGGSGVPLGVGLVLTMQTLVTGPIRSASLAPGAVLALVGLLPLWGWLAHWRRPQAFCLALWFLTPITLMFALGLFTAAFLKFLLSASPAWCLLVAMSTAPPRLGPDRPGAVPWDRIRRVYALGMLVLVSGSGLAAAWAVLPGYYTDPMARDNYQGVARYVQALGDPARDLVVLDAPGQKEVWDYYDPGLPVLALPRERPPDGERTIAVLAAAVAPMRRINALFWATDEADPDRIVEGWLDRNAFPGIDSWQGALRFVTYTRALDLQCRALQPVPVFGGVAALDQLCQEDVTATTAGDALLVGLHWRPLVVPDRNYSVSVQLLDRRDQVVAQRDSRPAGGSMPTVDWRPGTVVVDNHGVPIPLGTPPGAYRLALILYDPAAGGQRLQVATRSEIRDHVELGMVRVAGAPLDLPMEIVPIQHRLQSSLPGGLTLVGFDVYGKGYAHAPQTPIQPGDLVHVTLYWRGPGRVQPTQVAVDEVTLRLGADVVVGPLAGGAYPVAEWREGELVRAQFDILYQGEPTGNAGRRLSLQVGDRRLTLGQIP